MRQIPLAATHICMKPNNKKALSHVKYERPAAIGLNLGWIFFSTVGQTLGTQGQNLVSHLA